jgi:hypothetical protein
MEAYGTLGQSRVVLKYDRRRESICLFDEATGDQIESRPTRECADLRVERGIAFWGSRRIVLDKGEEGTAEELVALIARAAHVSSHDPADVGRRQGPADAADFDEDMLLREVARLDALQASSRASDAASVVSVLVVISGALPIILGLVVFFRDNSGPDESAVIGSGISFIVSGVVWIAVGLMLTQIVSAVAHYITYRTSNPGDPTDR